MFKESWSLPGFMQVNGAYFPKNFSFLLYISDVTVSSIIVLMQSNALSTTFRPEFSMLMSLIKIKIDVSMRSDIMLAVK